MVSNSSLVQWSDGTWSLCIGSEIFDINVHEMMDEEQNYIFSQHDNGCLMEDVGRITQKLLIKPGVSSSSSSAANRPNYSSSSPHWSKIAKTLSESKVKIAVMHRDPEAAKLEMDRVTPARSNLAIKFIYTISPSLCP